MSQSPANIQVTFTANYIGIHRVCYRLGSSGPYTCVETTCNTLGACIASCPIFVDDETCDDVTYTGYVQAACIAEDSTQDRVAFTATFTPNPTCKSYTVTCTHLELASVTVTDGGSGYNPGSPPNVNAIGGGGSAVLQAIVGSGGLSGGTITNPGAGYNSGTYTTVPITGGSGVGAYATVVVSGGQVTSITITAAGSGFTSGTGLGINPSGMGSPLVDAVFNFTTNYGKVTSVSVISSTQFESLPDIAIAPGTTPATAVAVLEDCPTFNSPGCIGADEDISAGTLSLGDSMVICAPEAPTIDTAYTVVQSGNCICDCTTASFSVSGDVEDQARYYYTSCGGEPQTGILTVGGSPSSVVACIVPGSLAYLPITPGTTIDAEYGPSCG